MTALLLLGIIMAPPPCLDVTVPPVRSARASASGSLVAAAVMALQAAGDADLTPAQLQRRLPRRPTPFDVILAAERRGFHTYVVALDRSGLAAALSLGLAPIALLKGRGKASHAAYVEGIHVGCGDPGFVLLRDPRGGNPQVSLDRFEARQFESVVVLVTRSAAALGRFVAARRGVRDARFDARFRAQGWLSRAGRLGLRGRARCEALQEAVAADSTFAAAREALSGCAR